MWTWRIRRTHARRYEHVHVSDHSQLHVHVCSCLVTVTRFRFLKWRSYNAQARLEDGEFVHTFTAEEGKLLEKLHCLREDGYEIDARLYSLAFGMDMGFQRAKLNAPTNITLPDFSGPGWDEYNRSYRRGFVHGFGFGSVGAFLPGLLLGVMCASSFAAYKKFAR